MIMSAKRIAGSTPRNQRRGRTNWARVDALTDRQIAAAIRADGDAAPLLDEAWFRSARMVLPEPKVPISIRVDRETLAWFRAQGPRYQARMNAVLRAYARAHRKPRAA